MRSELREGSGLPATESFPKAQLFRILGVGPSRFHLVAVLSPGFLCGGILNNATCAQRLSSCPLVFDML